MLVAKRDPFHAGAEDVAVPPRNGAAPRFGRAMSALQIAGTLMAIPAAIGSTYSVYRANFSVEATCQSLRANIVAILDKGVDATAQHMLVRRDVEAFQATCGGIDPDATAAFKVLLTGEKKSVPVASPRLAPVATVAPPRADAKPEAVVRKAEPRPAAVPKQSAAATAPGRVRSQADTTRCCHVRCDVAGRSPSGLGSPRYQSDDSCRTSADDDSQCAACSRPGRLAGVARNPHAGGNPYSGPNRYGPNGRARIAAGDIGGRRARAASRRQSSGAASANSGAFGKRCQRGSGASAQAVATWRLRCANTTGWLGTRSIALRRVSGRDD